MATIQKTEVEVKATAKADPAPKQVKLIQAVYGRMVDPHTGKEFTQTPKIAGEITGWVQSQLDAGKLVLV